MTNTLTLATNADGRIDVNFRAPQTPERVDVTLSCGDGCVAALALNFVTRLLAPPANVLAIPGDGRAWVLFDAPVGDVRGVEVRVGDGAWVGASATLPIRVDGLANGVAVEVRVRALAVDGPSAPSEAVLVTPMAVGAPDASIAVEGSQGTLRIPVVAGVATMNVPFTFTNEGDAPLASVWLRDVGLADGQRLVAITVSVGTMQRYGDRWFWRGFDLAPGASLTGTLTIEVDAP